MEIVHRAMELNVKEEPEQMKEDFGLQLLGQAAATAEDVPESAKTKKRRKSRKEISRDYRERLKENPKVLKAHREYEKNRFKDYYARRSNEAIQRNRELQRERQRQYRVRCKVRQAPKAPKTRKKTIKTLEENRERCKVRPKCQRKAPKTKKTLEEDRKRWREEKRLQRQNMSREKKASENKRRREAYAANKSSQNRCLSALLI